MPPFPRVINIENILVTQHNATYYEGAVPNKGIDFSAKIAGGSKRFHVRIYDSQITDDKQGLLVEHSAATLGEAVKFAKNFVLLDRRNSV